MLGRLYPNDPDFRGLTLNEYNSYGGSGFGVWNDPGMTPATACIPDPDPGEFFTDMNFQLFGASGRSDEPPTMCGFAENYVTQTKGSASEVMHYFTPEQVPVISALAKAFGVCDYWHASAPCQTWPNRFFAHTGTSLGYVDNKAFPIPFRAPSIFRRLEDRGKSWRGYFHDMPQPMLLSDRRRNKLTARDEAAPSLLAALSLAAPNNDGPPRIEPTLAQPAPELLSIRATAPPNGMQDSLANAAANLPLNASAPGDDIQAAVTPSSTSYPTVALAAAGATVRTNLFLGVAALES